MKSIFDAIQENIAIVNENVLAMAKMMEDVHKDMHELYDMFHAPEEPNARGEEGVDGVSSEPESK